MMVPLLWVKKMENLLYEHHHQGVIHVISLSGCDGGTVAVGEKDQEFSPTTYENATNPGQFAVGVIKHDLHHIASTATCCSACFFVYEVDNPYGSPLDVAYLCPPVFGWAKVSDLDQKCQMDQNGKICLLFLLLLFLLFAFLMEGYSKYLPSHQLQQKWLKGTLV